jgi:hypothetical protein
MPEYHNIFMALKTLDKLEIDQILAITLQPQDIV